MEGLRLLGVPGQLLEIKRANVFLGPNPNWVGVALPRYAAAPEGSNDVLLQRSGQLLYESGLRGARLLENHLTWVPKYVKGPCPWVATWGLRGWKTDQTLRLLRLRGRHGSSKHGQKTIHTILVPPRLPVPTAHLQSSNPI